MNSDERKRLLLDQAPDAVIFADRDGVIREWNRAAEGVFGQTQSEALGASLDIIVPERFRQAHWRGFTAALEAGETTYRGRALPTRSSRKDGSDLYVELTFSIIRDAAGQVIGALALARDISERWAREREQRQRLGELEERLADLTSPT